MASNRRDYRICPTCGAALDSGERCDCEALQAKAARVGLTLRRRRRHDENVFEMVNRRGFVVGEANDESTLSSFLDSCKLSW